MKSLKDEISSYFKEKNLQQLPNSALFLVGTNPLPVFVAAITLEPKKILLIGTEAVKDTMECLFLNLKKKLNLNPDSIIMGICNPSDSCDIRKKTSELITKLNNTERDLWLFYTAGTKAMAVQSYEEWKNNITANNNKHWAVYLSSDGPMLWFEGIPYGFAMFPNKSRQIKIPELKLEDILAIHQMKPDGEGAPSKDLFSRINTEYKNVARKIHDYIAGGSNGANDYYNLLPPTYDQNHDVEVNGHKMRITGELSYINGINLKENSFHTTMSLKQWATEFGITIIDPPTLDNVISWLSKDIPPSKNKKKIEWRESGLKWMATEWFETWVADTLEQSGLFIDVHESLKFIPPNSTKDVEVDVFAMRGHTPFVFSCTVDDKSSLGKHKLFEVRLRANQLGGDHARAAVVCLSDTPDVIEQELNQGWAGYGTIKVFGIRDIKERSIFIEELEKWITKFEQ